MQFIVFKGYQPDYLDKISVFILIMCLPEISWELWRAVGRIVLAGVHKTCIVSLTSHPEGISCCGNAGIACYVMLRSIYAWKCVCMYVWIYEYMYVRMYACMHVSVDMYPHVVFVALNKYFSHRLFGIMWTTKPNVTSTWATVQCSR